MLAFKNFLKKGLAMHGDAQVSDPNDPIYGEQLEHFVQDMGIAQNNAGYVTKAEFDKAKGRYGIESAQAKGRLDPEVYA